MVSLDLITQELIGTITLIIAIVLYIPIIIMVYFKRKIQPIMHRSPLLILTTLLASFLSVLSISFIFYLNFNSLETKFTYSCKFYTFSLYVLHFMIIIPYIFRSSRLVNVFNISPIHMNETFSKKKKLHESYYLTIIFYIFLALMINFILIMSSQAYSSFFPVDCEVCNNLGYHWYLIPELWFFIHLLESLIIFFNIFLLKNVQDEFNISEELIIIGMLWVFFEGIQLSNSFYFNYLDEISRLMIELFKHYIICIVTGMLPLMRTCQDFYLPICSTKECASNFNLALMNEKTFNAFYFYLKENIPEGSKYVNFWVDLNNFKNVGSGIEAENHTQILSTDIYDKYLKEGSEFYIEFPVNAVENIHKSYLNSSKNLYSQVFDDLLQHVYERLKDYYFPLFKNSEPYRKLEEELDKEEKLYSRLIESRMISTEID